MTPESTEPSMKRAKRIQLNKQRDGVAACPVLRGSRHLVPSTLRSAATPVLRSGSATEDGENGRA